jgi:dTDP-glucose pyrophosphorylase
MKPMTPPTLLVLAAGMGSRYGGLKQIDPVGPCGEVIIDYSIYDALRAGFGKLVFVIRKEFEQQFREIVGARFEKRVAVEYVYQELDVLPPGYSLPAGRTKPWGTAHAIWTAAAAIDEPFAVINADDFYGAKGFGELARYLESGATDYAMVGYILRNTLSDFGSVSRGVCTVGVDGFLQDVVELTKIERDGTHARNTDAQGVVTELTADEVVSMNLWGFTPRIFGQLQNFFERFLDNKDLDARAECYIPSAVNELVAAGRERVKVLRTSDSWFGITHREDHPRVVESIGRLIKDGTYPERLWS